MPMLRNLTARNVGTVYFIEELERAGKTYWDFLEYCDGLKCPIVVSPVHDSDEYTPEDVRQWLDRHSDKDHYSYITDDMEELEKVAPHVGDRKKAHVHFALKMDGRRNGKWYSGLFEEFVPIPSTRWQRVLNWDSYIRYFAHMDSPDKYQYSSMAIQGFGGVDLSCLAQVDRVTSLKVLNFVKKYMYESQIKYYHQLDRWAYQTGDADIQRCVSGRASYFASLFASMRNERQDKRQRELDKMSNDTLAP